MAWLRWAGSAQKLPRGAAKVIKAHGVFQKLLAGAGSWEAARVSASDFLNCASNLCMRG